MLQGDVNNLPLSALLQGLISNHNSGILILEGDHRTRRIGVSTGGIEFISDLDGNSEPLAQILTALDILQPEEISNILANLGNAALGDALLRLRLLDTSKVIGSIRTLFREQLLDLFQWQGASYRFEVCSWQQDRLFTGEGVAPSLHFPIPSLLLEVARREDEDHLNEAAGVDLDEIYEISSDKQIAESIIRDIIAIDPIDKKFARILQQYLPLEEAIVVSRAPRSLALESVRVLLQQGAIAPISSEQKKVLADRLLSQRRPTRAIAVLLSLLAREEDLPSLEKLYALLHQEKAPVGQRADILLRLARARSGEGDNVGCRKALRQRADLLPEDLDALLDLLDSLPGGKSRRETERLLEKIYKNVGTASEALRVAEALESCRGGDPIRDARWLERSARLRFGANDAEGASNLIDSLLRDGIRAGKGRKSVAGLLALLEQADPRSHDRWQSRFNRSRKIPSKKSGVIVLLGIVLGLIVFFQGRTSPEQASALPASKIPTGIEISTGIGKTTNLDAKDRNSKELINLERGLSHALRLRANGKYQEAQHQLSLLRTHQMPTTTIRTVEKFRREIETYLEDAQQLFDRCQKLAKQGRQAESLSLQLELARDYPHSPIVERMKLRLPLNLIPQQGQILIDGEVADIQKNSTGIKFVLLPAHQSVLLTAECPGHDSQLLWHEPGSHSQLEFRLSRLPDRVVDAEYPVETTLMGPRNSVIVIDRNSTIRSISSDRDETYWELTPTQSGDLVRGALVLEESIVVATTSGHLLRIDTRDGTIISQTQIPIGAGILRDAPIEAAGKIFISTSQGMVHALDQKSLEVIWTRQVELIRRKPMQATEELLIATGPTTLVGINLTDGSTAWQQDLSQRPLVCTSKSSALFIATVSEIIRYSTRTGKLIWRLPIDQSTPHSLATTSNLLLHLDTDGSLRAIDPAKGTIHWTTDGGKTDVLVSTTGRGLFAFGDSDKRIHVINLNSGQELWSHSGSSPGTSMTFVGEKLLVGDETGSLLLFDLPTAQVDLSTPEDSS
ncbi:MAG: PQQ-binding-like beta-propeller repeat protein [Planctomycetota bacterium]|nr:PQQ-binding-like beta-propeller repeat protein [Planctomycetota bacterium]